MFKKIALVIPSFLVIFFLFQGVSNADKSGIIKISKFGNTSQLVGAEII